MAWASASPSPRPSSEASANRRASSSRASSVSNSHDSRRVRSTSGSAAVSKSAGSTSSAGFSDRAGAVHAAEAWSPETGRWSLLARGQVTRVYHSTALLLPDGRVLHAGSGDGPGLPRELSAEIFSPPYLFQGPRPEVTGAPAAVGYGEQFFLSTPDAGRVVRVTLLRAGSVTHAFDQSQRFLELAFRKTAGGLTVTGPPSPTLAPPGPYLIFILNGTGVPSSGSIVRVG